MHLRTFLIRQISTFGALVFLLVAGAAAEPNFVAAEVGGVHEQYLVMLADGAARGSGDPVEAEPSVANLATELADLYGGIIERTWESAVRGFQIRISEAKAQRLAFDPAVRWVQQDRKIMNLGDLPQSCYGFDPLVEPGRKALQNIVCDDPDPRNPNRNCADNWGLDRIDQVSGARDGIYNYTNTAASVHVFTLDTGILDSHQEFQEFGPPWTRVVNGYNAILGGDPTNTTDCHGHGTHVAGIIGGSTTGVAKNVWLRPVKFFDGCGSPSGGNIGDVVSGLNWIHANHEPSVSPAVVNWSGGNGSAISGDDPHSNDPVVRQAVAALLAKGFSFVQAAGNQNDDLNGQPTDACQRSLGGVPGLEAVIVAGGTDANQGLSPVDGRWIREANDPSASLCTGSFKDCGSNSGSCIDIWAPAAHIISADADNVAGLCRLSGTSMAAPHVAGVAALYLQNNKTATPADVRQAIVSGATCGALDSDPSSPYYIGDGSPNLLLNSLLNGGGPGRGPGGCAQEVVVGEAGQVTNLRHVAQTVTLSRSYTNPVVIAQPPSYNGSNTSVVRILSVQPDRFSFYIDEAPDQDGLHTFETVSYLVVEAGSWRLADGAELRAGTLATSSTVGTRVSNVWSTVSYGTAFPTTPVVLSQVQTHSDSSWVKTRHSNVFSSSFRVALENDEASAVSHGAETVGWIAMTPSSGTWSGRPYAASRTPNAVTDAWYSTPFSIALGATPLFLAAMPTYDGGNNAGLRYRNLSSTSVEVRVEEDSTWDAEVAHTSEVVDYLILGGGGDLRGQAN